jgi:hypothetical protein
MFAVRADSPRQARAAALVLPGVHAATLFGETVHVLAEPGQQPGWLRASLAERGVAVADVARVDASLEDVFISLVGADEPAG